MLKESFGNPQITQFRTFTGSPRHCSNENFSDPGISLACDAATHALTAPSRKSGVKAPK